MWEYLSKLHPMLPYSMTLIAIIAIVIIALKGKLLIKWGKNTIGLGGSDSDDTGKPIPTPPNTVFIEKKRSCSDCSQIMCNEYEKCELSKRERADKILNYRMNYSEEKLIEFETEVTQTFEKRLAEESKGNSAAIIKIESKLFFGLFKDSLLKLKAEVRKSFRENGFCELTGVEFYDWVKNKTKVLTAILTQNLRSIYPSGTIVSIDSIISDIESKNDVIFEYTHDIYRYAKKVIEDNEEEVKELENKFNTWRQDFIK